MKFLAMSRRAPGASDAQVRALGQAEALAVFRLMRTGRLDQIHYSPDWRGAVLHVHADSRDDALALLARLPMAAAGLIVFDLWALEPYDHYERLFEPRFREMP